ncbi:MAG: Uma2 family endonuclease [Microcystaceae cyanobacterium]
MVAIPQSNYLTPEEYLIFEEKSKVKHEYKDGEVYAMAGASDTHVTIALNIASLLRNHVRGSGCRVYISDMKVQVETFNRFYYPDVFITCDSRDQETTTYKCYPKLIIEVLSDSTEAFDRGDKFIHYQTLESLEEYVLINSKCQRVECFRRNSEGGWIFEVYHPEGDDFMLKGIDFVGKISDLYEDVVFKNGSGNN